MASENSLLRLAQAAKEHTPAPKVLDEKQQEFLEWVLTPQTMRVPPTQTAYAEVHDVSLATLKRWKSLPHFREAYQRHVREEIATPERVEEATRLAYERGIIDGDIKWATLWAQMAGLTKIEPVVTQTRSEAIAEMSDEELQALVHSAAQAELERRKSG